MQQSPFHLEQTEHNIRNLAELIGGAESLLRTKTQQEGSSSLAVQQLQSSIIAAKEKYRQVLSMHAHIKKYVSAQEKRNSEKRAILSRGELEKLSANVVHGKVYENRNYQGLEKQGIMFFGREKLARTKEQWNKYGLEAVVPCQLDWKQLPPVLVGEVGETLNFGIFLKETKTGDYFPYSVRIFGVEENVVYWRWSKYQVFRLISERAQAALSYYMEQAIDSNSTTEKALDSLLEWLKSHEAGEDGWKLRFDMARSSFLPPCVRSFQSKVQSLARYPETCVSSKHRKLDSFIGTTSS
ncbi:hypothetical protein GpartN1_g4925.t1 [Galdieria partita]|uniref:Uncharacterized protein n=1 Tax=Galdieria partita TaxID=83374 RepID=A0A9C7URL5_9RHOD|nr:hypothetical protein GpartN1_g4925.t1 [Galdieria partita]